MDIKTEGLVLKRIKYSDSKIILHVFTPDYGRIAAIITVGKSKASKYKRHISVPLQYVKLVLMKPNKGDLYRIKEIKHAFIYKNLMQDLKRSAVGIYLLEFLDKSLKESSKQTDLYSFFLKAITHLDIAERTENIHIHTITNMTKYFGIYPNIKNDKDPFFDMHKGETTPKLSGSTINETLTRYLRAFLITELQDSGNIAMNRNHRIEFLEKMESYWSYHCESFIRTKSLKVLQDVIP